MSTAPMENQPYPVKLLVLAGMFGAMYILSFLILSGIMLTEIDLARFSENPDLSGLISFNLDSPSFVFKLKIGQIITSVLIFIVPSVLMASIFSSGYKKYLYISKTPSLISTGIAALLILSALPAINAMAQLNNMLGLPDFLSGLEQWMRDAEAQAEKLTKAFLMMDTPVDLILNIVMIAVIPAIGEELLFRGVVQKLFSGWTKNIHWGVWISAILFSAMHGQFLGFLPRMMLGALLGYLLVWSGSLWLPIFAHFVNNASAVLISYLISKKIISEDVENIGSGKEEIIYTAVSFIVVVLLLFTIKKTETKRNEAIQN
jgi:uncharacterized protein